MSKKFIEFVRTSLGLKKELAIETWNRRVEK